MAIRFLFTLTVLVVSPQLVWAATYSSEILGDNPAGYWRLDEGSGPTADNLGSNGAASDGTYDGTFGFGAGSLVNSEPDNDAAEFNGTDSRVLLPEDQFTSETSARSAELWFEADNVDLEIGMVDAKQILWEEGGATRGFNMYLYNGELYFHAWNNASL